MARFCFSIWPFTTHSDCQIGFKFAKVGSKLWQMPNKPSKIAQEFYNLGKVSKFCQLWSHCLTRWKKYLVTRRDRSRGGKPFRMYPVNFEKDDWDSCAECKQRERGTIDSNQNGGTKIELSVVTISY